MDKISQKKLTEGSPFVTHDGETWTEALEELYGPHCVLKRWNAWLVQIIYRKYDGDRIAAVLDALLVQLGAHRQSPASLPVFVVKLDRELLAWALDGGPVWPVESLRDYFSWGAPKEIAYPPNQDFTWPIQLREQTRA